jgi:hypothetical protein
MIKHLDLFPTGLTLDQIRASGRAAARQTTETRSKGDDGWLIRKK